MSYAVIWRVVGPGERVVDRDGFPEAFSHREDAVAFILDRLSDFPVLGYDRGRGFWGRGATGSGTETRFSIVRAPVLAEAAQRS